MAENPYEPPTVADASAIPKDALILCLRAARRRAAVFNAAAAVAWAAFFVAVLLQFAFRPYWVSMVACFALLPIAIVLAFIGFRAWRCPSCKRLLAGTRDPKYCPECGIRYVPAEE
jgi:hypothetical protein